MKKAKAVYEFLPIYGRHIFYGNDIDALKKLIRQYYKESDIDVDELDGDNCYGFVCPLYCLNDDERVRAYVMYVRDDADIGTVAHEAIHLVNRVFFYLEQELEALNDEVVAYFTGYLTQRFLELIRGHKPTSNKPLEKIKKRK